MLVSPSVSGFMAKSPMGRASPDLIWGGISDSWILMGASTEISPEVKDDMNFMKAGSGPVDFRFQVHPSIVRTAAATARKTIRRQMPEINMLKRCLII
jgi:hypothetical protein